MSDRIGFVRHFNLEKELNGEKITAVHKTGDYWNWIKFKQEPCTFFVFTEHRVIEYGWK